MILLAFLGFSAQAQEANQELFFPLDNGITIGEKGKVASDLIYDGKKLSPFEILKLREQGWDGKFDLSTLDPETNTYWLNKYRLNENLNAEDEKIEINSNSTVSYIRPGSLADEESSIHVLKNEKTYEIIMSNTNYRSMMMKTLLRKIGYFIPKLKRIDRVKVEFESYEQKLSFLEHYNWIHNLEIDIDDDEDDEKWKKKDKWIYHNPENKNWIILQDVIVRDITEGDLTNLALEPFEEPEIQNKRSLNSLLVPYTILNYSGSTNAFEWWAGKLASQNIYLDYPSAPQFEMDYKDGQWMLRRLSKLTRADWEEIVKGSALPGAVQKVVLEKVIARYNSLITLFQMDLGQAQVNYKLSQGVDLDEGKLLTCAWENYAVPFCDSDKENPIGRTDLWEFIKSKAFSTALNGVMSFINSTPALSTDISKENSSIIEKAVNTALNNFETSGTEENVLMKKWNFNYHNYNIIFSRNLVTGRFQGSDQLVSLVDSVGVSLGIGKYFAQMGYNEFLTSENLYQGAGKTPGYNVSPVSARLGGQVSRVYSHITPVTSIKDANQKLPFKESIVPLVKGKLGRIFNKLHDSQKGDISREELLASAREDLKKFKEKLKLGESFLITDTIGATSSVGGTASYKKLAELSLGGGADYTVLNRIHILRAGPNNLHVYKNFGNLARLRVASQLALVGVPVARWSLEKIPGGKAKTQFFNIDLSEDNPELVSNLLAIRSLFVAGTLRPLKKVMRPVTLKFKYNQTLRKVGVFWFNFNRIKSSNNIEVITPENESKRFARYYDGKSNGKNIANYGSEVLQYLIKKNAKFDIQILDTPLNPGLSITGKAKNKEVTYELEFDEDENVLGEFAYFADSSNGWEADRETIDQKIKELEMKYKYDYFLENPGHDTKKILVYHLAANFYVYNQGIENMFNIPVKSLKNIFIAYSQDLALRDEIEEDTVSKAVSAYKKYKKRYLKAVKNKDWKKAGINVSKTIQLLTGHLTLDGLAKVWGGTENFYTYATLNGFRDGVEQKGMNYESQVKSNSFGTLGEFFEVAPRSFNDERSAPLSMLEQSLYLSKWGMTRGELYLNWILGRIY